LLNHRSLGLAAFCTFVAALKIRKQESFFREAVERIVQHWQAGCSKVHAELMPPIAARAAFQKCEATKALQHAKFAQCGLSAVSPKGTHPARGFAVSPNPPINRKLARKPTARSSANRAYASISTEFCSLRQDDTKRVVALLDRLGLKLATQEI